MAYIQDGQQSLSTQCYIFDDALSTVFYDLRSNNGPPAASGFTTSAANPGQVYVTVQNVNDVGNANYNSDGQNGINSPNFIFGGGFFTWVGYFNLSALGGTDHFQWWIGVHDGWQYSGPSNGAYFFYDSSVSANWQIVSNNAGTATTTTSSSVVATGWHKFSIIYTTSSINYFVDGVNIGTITTNLPGSNVCNISANKILKTLGNTLLITVKQDYFEFQMQLTTPR
jgi:hypothetical protein